MAGAARWSGVRRSGGVELDRAEHVRARRPSHSSDCSASCSSTRGAGGGRRGGPRARGALVGRPATGRDARERAPRGARRVRARGARSDRDRRARRRGQSGFRPRSEASAREHLRERVLLTLPVGRSPPRGAILETVVRVAEPRVADRAGGFDERAWLARQGIHVVLRGSTWRQLGSRGGIAGGGDRLRNRIESAIGRGSDGVRRALVLGVVLGEDEGLPEAVKRGLSGVGPRASPGGLRPERRLHRPRRLRARLAAPDPAGRSGSS